MKSIFLAYCYAWYQMLAYLASHMDTPWDVQEHQSTADEYHRQWVREQIQ